MEKTGVTTRTEEYETSQRAVFRERQHSLGGVRVGGEKENNSGDEKMKEP